LTEPNGKVHSLDRGGVFGLAAPQGSSLSGITFTCDVPGETQTVRMLGAEPGSTGGWKLLAGFLLYPRDRIKTAELAAFGAADYELAMVPSLTPTEVSVRSVNSNVSSVQIVGIKPHNAFKLMFVVTVKNVSSKGVWSMAWSTKNRSGALQ